MADDHHNERTITFTPLTPGTEVGPYRLIRQLGIGGMGEVFLAHDNRLERQVALKFLAFQFTEKEDFRQRFMREARSAAKLTHNNVVTVHEVGETDERVYIAMEYVQGRSLRQLIDTRGSDYEQSLAIFDQICQGLKKAHTAGIIHRDLKPANIMVTDEHQVKILDFGLAKGIVDGNLTSTGTAMGTVNYMSPEQAQGNDADNRSDIFSTGILLFELLTGVNPFVRGHMPATIHAIVYEPIGQLSEYNADLSPSWQTIVEKALGKKPDDRYQSVEELMADIERLKAGEDITPAAVAQPSIARSDMPSLAVLHLRNLGDEDDDFLTYGITEDLIVDLSRLGSMRVMPMRRILKYKDSDLELEELGRNLNVNMILDGSIRRSDSAVRISAQLVDVTTDDILWSNRWEESLDSLPKIKSALAEGISAALNVNSSVIRKADIAKAETSNPVAYDFYLKGKYAFQNRKKKEDINKAVEHYEQALKLEPSMIAAKVGLAEIYSNELEDERALELLKPALDEAIAHGLKADEARVRTVQGIAHNRIANFDESIKSYKAAIELYNQLDDINGEAWAMSELFKPFFNISQYDEVFKLESRFGQLTQKGADPAYVVMGLSMLTEVYFYSDQYERSENIMNDALQLARANDIKPVLSKLLLSYARKLSFSGGQQLQIAMNYLEEARFIAERLEDKWALVSVDFSTVLVELSSGQFRMAKERIERTIPDLKESHNTHGLGSQLLNKAAISYLMGQYDNCLIEIGPAREANDQLDEKNKEISTALLDGLEGAAKFRQGNIEEAVKCFNKSIERYRQIGVKSGLDQSLAELSVIQYEQNNKAEAKKNLTEAYNIADESKNLEAQVLAGGYLGLLQAEEGNLEEAKKSLLQLVEASEGHFAEVTARRCYGQLLLEHSTDQSDHEKGRREILQALALARRMEYEVEKTIISALLEKHS